MHGIDVLQGEAAHCEAAAIGQQVFSERFHAVFGFPFTGE